MGTVPQRKAGNHECAWNNSGNWDSQQKGQGIELAPKKRAHIWDGAGKMERKYMDGAKKGRERDSAKRAENGYAATKKCSGNGNRVAEKCR